MSESCCRLRHGRLFPTNTITDGGWGGGCFRLILSQMEGGVVGGGGQGRPICYEEQHAPRMQ
jgi:hypothetical protein